MFHFVVPCLNQLHHHVPPENHYNSLLCTVCTLLEISLLLVEECLLTYSFEYRFWTNWRNSCQTWNRMWVAFQPLWPVSHQWHNGCRCQNALSYLAWLQQLLQDLLPLHLPLHSRALQVNLKLEGPYVQVCHGVGIGSDLIFSELMDKLTYLHKWKMGEVFLLCGLQ